MDDHGSDRYRRPGSPVRRESGPISGSGETEGGDAETQWTWGDWGGTLLGILFLLGLGSWAYVERLQANVADATGRQVAASPAAEELAPSLELPVEVNERVDRWIQRYLTDQRHGFEQFLSRENLYGELIRSELRERGMPRDLLYVAMIESGFSAQALSPKEASGLWQFMTPTARDYGLRVTEYVDERRDPIRATRAALSYLEALHARFDSWYLAAAAYNAGPNRVARLLAERGGRTAGEEQLFWEIVDRLPSETRDYVPKLLAATLLAREAGAHGFQVDPSEPYAFERVWVPGGTSLERIAGALELPVSRLRHLNPHLIRGVTPPGTSYGVRVPPGQAPLVVASLGKSWKLADDD